MESAAQFAATKKGQPIGGWLLKANPAQFDVLSALDETGLLWEWPLDPSYRVTLMAPGQPVFMWLTAGDSRQESGLIAIGTVTTYSDPLPVDESAEDGAPTKPIIGDPVACGFWIERLATPVLAADVKAQGALAKMELFHLPQMGSPLVLSPDEVEALWATFDLTTLPGSEDAQDAAAIAAAERNQRVVIAAVMGGLEVGVNYDAGEGDFFVVSPAADEDEAIADLGCFVDPHEAAAAMAGMCEGAAQEVDASAPSELGDDGEAGVLAILAWGEFNGRIVKTAAREFSVQSNGWDAADDPQFTTFGEALGDLVDEAFDEWDSEDEA